MKSSPERLHIPEDALSCPEFATLYTVDFTRRLDNRVPVHTEPTYAVIDADCHSRAGMG